MLNQEKLEKLKKFSLFKDITENELILLAEKINEANYKKKDLIIEQDAEDNNIYFITQGLVKIYRLNEDGKEINLAVLGESNTIGEIAPFMGGVRTAYAEAQSDVKTYVLQGKILRDLIAQDKLAMNLIDIFCERINNSNKHLESISSQTLKERTMSLLTVLSNQLLTKSLEITQEDVANILSATRPRVTEALQELEKEGKIELAHRSILLI